MEDGKKTHFSGPVNIFHGIQLPLTGTPAGYAALIDAYGLRVPFPRRRSAIGLRHKAAESGEWKFYSPRYTPQASLSGHLTFALKYEGIDLAILFCLFHAIKQPDITRIIKNAPTGKYSRRLWFLYEWLTRKKLPLSDLTQGTYIPVVEPNMQLAVPGERISRQRVLNNLPGTPDFCPLVFRSKKIDHYLSVDLKAKALETIDKIPRDVIARTAAFLLLQDSKSSYIIEGEEPPQTRIQRWGQAIGEAGKNPLQINELIRLQSIIIGDSRFIQIGPRKEGGFVGEHDRKTGQPIPEHISARPDDLEKLIGGLIDFDNRTFQKMNPVVIAACIAFGFVYIHPFEDGNGRIHRYLMHHVLAQNGFNPPGISFPISSVILHRIDEYRDVLRKHSRKILPHMDWDVTADRNVTVKNKTDYLYRFFDATPHSEFLFSCVEQTIENDIPREARLLKKYDEFRKGVTAIIDMPDRTVDLLFRFLKQNDGKLSKRAQEREFKQLTAAESQEIETLYRTTFHRPPV